MSLFSNPRQFPLVERLKRWTFDTEDRHFERRHGLELADLVPHEQLISSNREALDHATAYQGVWCRNVRTLLAQARRFNPALENFVDLGAGKGKACLYASTQQAFDSIIGVELSEPLVEIARKNLARFAQRHPEEPIRFVAGDAATYDLPVGDTVVFMYNPFDGVILERFLQRNREHLASTRSVVAYANDIHRGVLTQQGFTELYRDPARCVSLYTLRRQAGN
jgi:SAM-dependent methyltransferase